MADPLRDGLRWYRVAWAAEVPEVLHRHGVEWDKESGGSLLGTPRWSQAFTAYLDGGAYDVEYATYDGQHMSDPHYVRPLRCALAYMAHHGHPFMARWLFALGIVDGDWSAVADRFGLELEVAEVFTRQALFEANRRYVTVPQATRLSA